MKVPSKDYARQYAELLPELMPRIERVLLGEDPVLGAPLEAFEHELAEYLGARAVVGVGSGTDALSLSLRALGIGPGDEVITAANTFFATVSAIAQTGARPVLVDPDPETLNLGVAGLADAFGAQVRAVIPVHLYGRMAPMQELGALCAERGVWVVEDAAQAHGARQGGRAAGTWGRLGCFSFHPSKNLGAFGDGGAIATDEPELERELRMLRNLGKVSKYEVRRLAPNSKLDTLQATILSAKLTRLDSWNVRRRSIAALYEAALTGVGDLALPLPAAEGEHVWHLYVVRTEARDELHEALAKDGVRAGMHYPIPPHLQDLDVGLGYGPGDFPVAEAAARTGLSLPIAPELLDEEIHHVCARVRAFFGEAAV